MTRRSKREVARALEELGAGEGGDDPPDRIVIQRDVVDEDLEVLETTERVIER